MTAIPRLRAPREDGTILAEPALVNVGRLLADNRRRLATARRTFLGRPLADLRRQAGRETIQAATAYLFQAGEPIPTANSAAPLLLAGHQPELFHPGVWIKNFALQRLAAMHGLVPLNLVVDNDTVKTTALRLPSAASTDPDKPQAHLTAIPFDTWGGEVPYEERHVQDEALFASLAERAAAVIRPWKFSPLLPDFWDDVCRQAARTSLMGERFAAARRSLERRWHCHNFELPISALCQTEAFAWFACQVLADLPQFASVYNAALHEHRRQHGMRSKNHPVPDLARQDQWWEAPFWGWREGSTQRGRLFARCIPGQVELRVNNETWPSLPNGDDPRPTVGAFQELAQRGCKVRPRALTTTLFARLVVGDLFIHGIGGGKYDELTDAIMHRYFQVDPPAFVILSATLLLPLPRWPADVGQRRSLQRRLRDLHYKPQNYLVESRRLEQDELAAQLVRKKQEWIDSEPVDRPARRERFQMMRKLNEEMWPYVSDPERTAVRELALVEEQLEVNAVLQRRDYAFCLFPEKKLRDFFTCFMEKMA